MRGSVTIKETLARLYSQESSTKHFADESVTRASRAIHEFVDGEYVNTPFGDIFVSRVRHSPDYIHGIIPLKDVTRISDNWLSRWGKFSSDRKFDFRKTVFVDTETSGVAGGGGTLPFLIGIGYFYRGRFHVEQFFADSHSREEGMLDLVAQFVKPFDTLVTFNGKAFDIPLLETRYLLKRKQNPFSTMEHLDLLHPSRQLWNLTLDNCKLQTIEYRLLDFRRENDLPGEEIPQAYFDYVRWGKADPLYRVFQHNADDITSLAAAMYLLWRTVQNEESDRDSRVEFSRGKILRRYGEMNRATRSLESARQQETSSRRRAIIMSFLSMVYKSEEKWDEAEALWLEMIETGSIFHLLPYVELAKYYEHRTKDLKKARKVAEDALSRIPSQRVEDIDGLKHRLNRLDRRISRAEEEKK